VPLGGEAEGELDLHALRAAHDPRDPVLRINIGSITGLSAWGVIEEDNREEWVVVQTPRTSEDADCWYPFREPAAPEGMEGEGTNETDHDGEDRPERSDERRAEDRGQVRIPGPCAESLQFLRRPPERLLAPRPRMDRDLLNLLPDHRRESMEKLRADALGVLAEAALGGGLGNRLRGEPYQVVLHVDAALLAGTAGEGRCELEGGAGVAVETCRRIACDGAVRVVTHGPDGAVEDVGPRCRPTPWAPWWRRTGPAARGPYHTRFDASSSNLIRFPALHTGFRTSWSQETRAPAEDPMKVLALNSSPRTGGQSKTERMLGELVEGMREAGAHVDVIALREKRIHLCSGCYSCWTQTPGTCIHRDDMTAELLPKWLAADLVVYATPLYFHTMNAAMSAFRERLLPVALPFLEPRGDRTGHPLRYRYPPSVWLSVCGFPERSAFDVLSDYLHRTLHPEGRLVAEIYRPGAEMLTNPRVEETARDIFDAVRQAGRELITNLAVSPETMDRITRPIVDVRTFRDLGNLFWKTCIAEGVTPRQFAERGMVPRPDSLEAFQCVFPLGIDTRAAGDRTVVMQFHFSGPGALAGSCSFTVHAGGVTAAPGTAQHPDLVVRTPFEVWMDIMTGKVDGGQMFMEQRYTVEGDLGLMLALVRKHEARSP